MHQPGTTAVECPASTSKLICHIIYRLDFGGLENGLVNLINHMPSELFRHAIISLLPPTDFQNRLTNPATQVFCLHKQAGKDVPVYGRAWRLLRALRPAIVHTRNIATLDMLLPARLAGVRRLVHSEHGLDMHEVDGQHRVYNLLRRWSRPLVSRYVAVSADLAGWLRQTIGVTEDKLRLIYNGVDTTSFAPGLRHTTTVSADLLPADRFIIGTIGRFELIKDQLMLCRAFIEVVALRPELRPRLRLALIGAGSQHAAMQRLLADAGVADLAWLPGYRDDTAHLYRHMSLFVLPSRREGISNTILEAMASGLPVIATAVGGNPELVVDQQTGMLVPANAPQDLARAILRYLDNPALLAAHGAAARQRAMERFSLTAMVSAYTALYRGL